LRGASSVAVSPDGRNVYSAAFASDSIGIFRRVTRAMTR
jgi:DNA-binding beta-propeller fold protein YncE